MVFPTVHISAEQESVAKKDRIVADIRLPDLLKDFGPYRAMKSSILGFHAVSKLDDEAIALHYDVLYRSNS